MNEGHTRRLQAILAADVVGYSRLMNRDEEGTLTRLQALEREVVDPSITGHGGEVVKRLGDGVLAVFPSAVKALSAARAIQAENASRQAGEALPITYRIGLNVGDVIVTETDIFGDGVNIAARLEGLADPGGITLSAAVHDNVRAQDPGPFDDLGDRQVKNIEHPIRVYRVHYDDSPPLPAVASRGLSRPLLVAGLMVAVALLAWAFWPAAETHGPAAVVAPEPGSAPSSAPVTEPVTSVARPAPVTTSPNAPRESAPVATPTTSRNELPPGSTPGGTTDTTKPGFSERLFDSIAEAVEEELASGTGSSGSSSKSGKSKDSPGNSKGKGKNK